MAEWRDFGRKILASTALAGTLGLGIAAEPESALPPVTPSVTAYNPVNGPDSALINTNSIVHMGGMLEMANMEEDNIFHALAAVPASQRVLKVGVITQPQMPDELSPHNVQTNEYTPLSDDSIETLTSVLDEFTSITGIPTEIVENDYSAPLLVGAYNTERIERQIEEQKENPDLVVAGGFATRTNELLAYKPSSLHQGLLMMHQEEGKTIKQSTTWHEFLHYFTIIHSRDKHGTLGNFHDEDGRTYSQPKDMQQATSIMAYGSPLNKPGPVDRYVLYYLMEKAGLTPPAARVNHTSLNESITPSGDIYRYQPVETQEVKPNSLLEGTDLSDVLVTEEGLCGSTRHEYLSDKKLYCVVEGNYADVFTGAGDDLVLASRLHDQTIHLGEDTNSVMILDEHYGIKTLRHETNAEPAERNTLVLSDTLLQESTVKAIQQGDSIVLDFITDNQTRTRITLVDHVNTPVINELQIALRLPSTQIEGMIQVDIASAVTAKHFEHLFNAAISEYREKAITLYDDPSRRMGEVYLGDIPALEKEEIFPHAVSQNTNYWKNRILKGEDYKHWNGLSVAYSPPVSTTETAAPKQPESKKLPHFAHVGSVNATLRREQDGKNWENRLTEGRAETNPTRSV